jgi:hypothetical protein
MMVASVELPNPTFGVVPAHRFTQALGHRHCKPIGIAWQKKTVAGPTRTRNPLRRTWSTSRFPRSIIRRGSP